MIELPRTKAEALAAGLKHYFTGIPCPKGHIEKRNIYGHCHGCVREVARTEERRVRARAYRKESKRRAYEKDWQENNKARVCEYVRQWRKKNPEAGAEYMRKRRETDGPVLLAQERERYQSKREHFAEKNKKYRQDNPDLIALYARNRRARKKTAAGSHTRKDVVDILRMQKYCCGYCKVDLYAGYHVDHIIPLALGGSNDRKNLQALCPTCNIKKQDKHPIDFAREIGRLL